MIKKGCEMMRLAKVNSKQLAVNSKQLAINSKQLSISVILSGVEGWI